MVIGHDISHHQNHRLQPVTTGHSGAESAQTSLVKYHIIHHSSLIHVMQLNVENLCVSCQKVSRAPRVDTHSTHNSCLKLHHSIVCKPFPIPSLIVDRALPALMPSGNPMPPFSPLLCGHHLVHTCIPQHRFLQLYQPVRKPSTPQYADSDLTKPLPPARSRNNYPRRRSHRQKSRPEATPCRSRLLCTRYCVVHERHAACFKQSPVLH